MSYYFFFSDQETSELSEDFNPPIILENDGFYEIGLTNFSVNNAIPNVDEKNNKFHYGDKDEVIEIPVGSYEIADINKYLKTILTNKTSKEEKDKIYLHLQANFNTLKCEIKCNKTIDFSKPNSIGQLLGFERRQLARNKLHMSDFPVDIMRVNMIRIECNIATNSYRNGQPVHIIHSFYPTDPPGYKIVESPRNVIYLPINTHIIHNISLKIIDQNGFPVNFRKEVVTVTLHLRKV
jgi:hypothetical protein